MAPGVRKRKLLSFHCVVANVCEITSDLHELLMYVRSFRRLLISSVISNRVSSKNYGLWDPF